MSKLGCECGHIIRHQTDSTPYKGHVPPDVRLATFLDWLFEPMQSNVEAAQGGRVEQWLLERGYGQDYVDRKPSHGEVLQNRITTQFCMLKRDLFDARPVAASIWRRAMTISP
jgi:hypothetical protein